MVNDMEQSNEGKEGAARPSEADSSRMARNTGYGVAIGLLFGVLIGLLTHNVGLWIAIGLAIGIGLGSSYDLEGVFKKHPEE